MQCSEDYYESFSSYEEMLEFHSELRKNSSWQDAKVSDIEVYPLKMENLDAGIETMPKVSTEAIIDAISNTGLAVKVNEDKYPLASTAYAGLCERAKVGGSSLKHLERFFTANIFNRCLEIHTKSTALALIRFEKVMALHSKSQYSILDIDDLLKAIQTELDNRFEGNVFVRGSYSHDLSSATWALPVQAKSMMKRYHETLADSSRAGIEYIPQVEFTTSDIGSSKATVRGYLSSEYGTIPVGDLADVIHRHGHTVDDFTKAIKLIYNRFVDTIVALASLSKITLDHPVNAMVAVGEKESFPKKALYEVADLFGIVNGSGPATALDVFYEFQSVKTIYETTYKPLPMRDQLAKIDEKLAKLLRIEWTDYDYAMRSAA